MSDLPQSVQINEEGPREGFQFERGRIPTERKVELMRTARGLLLDQTGGTLKLWPVMLYNSLEQMTEAGLIQEIGGSERPTESERRRYYRLTTQGRAVLKERRSLWNQLVAAINRVTEVEHG